MRKLSVARTGLVAAAMLSFCTDQGLQGDDDCTAPTTGECRGDTLVYCSQGFEVEQDCPEGCTEGGLYAYCNPGQEPDTDTDTESESDTDTDTSSDSDSDNNTDPDTDTDTGSDTDIDTDVDTDTDTDSDTAADTDTDVECECTSGMCCDGCNFRPISYTCDSETEYGCPWGEGCGEGDVGSRIRYRHCSASSSSCSGAWGAYGSWSVASACGSSKRCVSGSSSCDSCDCDMTLTGPPNGGSLDLDGDTFTWDQPCDDSVYIYVCPSPDVDDCSVNWLCLAAGLSTGGTASYSGGGGTGYRGAFYCTDGGLSVGGVYYWTVDSPWSLPPFRSFHAF